MADTHPTDATPPTESLNRSITGRLLFFYVLGDVLGAGIYVLIGDVAGEVGGAFWVAFAVGVSIATMTGLAYAELVTKYPQAAGAALYVHKAFKSKALTFLITFSMLSASFAAAGSLASGFSDYFAEVWSVPPGVVVAVLFILTLAAVNFIGITESVLANLVMTIVEISGLVIVLLIGAVVIFSGDADFGVLFEFSTTESVPIALLAGVAFSFFAMTGFENAANVAEETKDPARSFPRALIGGMAVAGLLYVLVSMSAALTVDPDKLASSDAALITVAESGVLPIAASVMGTIFAVVAMVAITNTTLVALVTQARILYGMANENVVPGVFGWVHQARRTPWIGVIFSAAVVSALLLTGAVLERLAIVTVVFTLFIYMLVIASALKIGDRDEHDESFRAPRVLLGIGIVANGLILFYVIYDDPATLLWCAGLLAVGFVLLVIEWMFTRSGPGTPATSTKEI